MLCGYPLLSVSMWESVPSDMCHSSRYNTFSNRKVFIFFLFSHKNKYSGYSEDLKCEDHLVVCYTLSYVFWPTGLSKQYRPRWDTAKCGVSSRSTLFATHPHTLTQCWVVNRTCLNFRTSMVNSWGVINKSVTIIVFVKIHRLINYPINCASLNPHRMFSWSEYVHSAYPSRYIFARCGLNAISWCTNSACYWLNRMTRHIINETSLICQITFKRRRTK